MHKLFVKLLEILARGKDVEHDVKISEMSSNTSRHRDNTCYKQQRLKTKCKCTSCL